MSRDSHENKGFGQLLYIEGTKNQWAPRYHNGIQGRKRRGICDIVKYGIAFAGKKVEIIWEER